MTKLQKPFPTLRFVLEQCRPGTAVIRYRLDGDTFDWLVSADPETDDIDSLREHLAACVPGAEFVSAGIR